MNPRYVGLATFFVTACTTLAILGLQAPALIVLGVFAVFTVLAVLVS